MLNVGCKARVRGPNVNNNILQSPGSIIRIGINILNQDKPSLI